MVETSRNFDDMNAGFKALIKDIRHYKTVKEVCAVKGFVDSLKELLTTFKSCEI